MQDNKYLKKNSTSLNLLYIEGKDKFKTEVSDLLKEFFENIYVAKNAEESVGLFIKHHPQVVIMDIDVDISDFNWVEAAMHLKEINPEVKIITLSKNDNQKFLLDAIDIGITKFLIKPIEHHKLLDVLEVVKDQLSYENDRKIFYTYLHSVYSEQKSMVMMIKDKKPLLANQTFLDFFNVESIHKFTQKYGELDTLFLKHGNSVNGKSGKNWFDTISKGNKKQYRILLKDKNGEPRHFLFKYHLIPEQKSYAILSFDDITEMNLTGENDTQTNQTQPVNKESKDIFKLLSSIHKNQREYGSRCNCR